MVKKAAAKKNASSTITTRKAGGAKSRKGVAGKSIKKAHRFTVHTTEVHAEFQKVLKKYRKRLSDLPGVNRVSGGYQYKKGICTGKLAIRLETGTIDEKAKLRKLFRKLGVEVLDTLGVRKAYGSKNQFPLDIVVRDYRVAATAGDPITTSHLDGTLGGVVTLTATGGRVWVTAAHVVSKSSPLPAPDPASDVVVFDGGVRIGVVPNNSSSYFQCSDTVDCALIQADVDPGAPLAALTLDSSGVIEGLAVKMSGAVTHDSRGKIESADPVSVQIKDELGNIVTIQDHFYVTATKVGSMFATQGDSGAFVFLDDGSNTVVGIVRAADQVVPSNDQPLVAVISKISNAKLALGFR